MSNEKIDINRIIKDIADVLGAKVAPLVMDIKEKRSGIPALAEKIKDKKRELIEKELEAERAAAKSAEAEEKEAEPAPVLPAEEVKAEEVKKEGDKTTEEVKEKPKQEPAPVAEENPSRRLSRRTGPRHISIRSF